MDDEQNPRDKWLRTKWQKQNATVADKMLQKYYLQ